MKNQATSLVGALFLAALSLASTAPALRADQADEINELRAQVQALEKKLDAIEQKQAEQDQRNAAAVATAQAQAQQAQASATAATAAAAGAQAQPKISIDDTGFKFASNDGADFIKLHGLVQLDSRWFFHDDGIANNDTFLIRRARLIFEGAFEKIYSFQIVPEYGGGGSGTSNAPVIYDANLGIALSPAVQFKFGKFKAPIGWEMLQNDATLLFPERSLATNLVPSRDIGVQEGGSVWANTLSYTLAVLNGGADGTYANNVDLDNNKDFIVRVIASPWADSPDSPLHGLDFGVAGSRGLQNKTAGLTSGYRTDAQQTFFTYRSSVTPDGAGWRLAPQADYYLGPLSAEAEYTVSSVEVITGTSQRGLRTTGWQGSLAYILTGESASYNGFTPKQPFNPSAGTWGAWEIAARVDQLKIDPNAFPLFADPAASARGANSISFGLNWYLSKTIRLTADFLQTSFDRAGAGPATNAVIGQDERAVLTRFQVGF